MSVIRSNLKEILDAHNIPIRKAARDIDYRFESVRQLYNDEMERYPRDLIGKLCVYLNVTPNELLRLEHGKK